MCALWTIYAVSKSKTPMPKHGGEIDSSPDASAPPFLFLYGAASMKHILFAAAILMLFGVAQGISGPVRAQDEPSKDIVDTAAGDDQFKTLVSAVKAAELVDTLKGEGPFTVFAPNDEAFAKLPKEKLEALLKDKEALAKILKYHVVDRKLMAADVTKLGSAKTVQGKELKVETKDGEVKVNGAKVVKTDIACKNGVIHVIDTVLLSPDDKE
jgi:uncharacterized surface protein with fasciclin (FAS1) repeats